MPPDSETFCGNYPLETTVAEFERLRIQSEAMAPEAERLLRAIGVGRGWACVDLGCGPFGIASLLAPMVGVEGSVLGLDRNESFLERARSGAASNTEYRNADAYRTGLPGNAFDLVHMRFLASTAGQPERLFEEALRIARPGGWIALQEPDGSSLNCFPPHSAWDRLKGALLGAFAGSGADLTLARRLYALGLDAGLEEVQYRTFLLAVRAQDAMVDYLPSTVASLRSKVVELGILTDEDLSRSLEECREHLRKPSTSFTMYTVAQVWGRKPT